MDLRNTEKVSPIKLGIRERRTNERRTFDGGAVPCADKLFDILAIRTCRKKSNFVKKLFLLAKISSLSSASAAHQQLRKLFKETVELLSAAYVHRASHHQSVQTSPVRITVVVVHVATFIDVKENSCCQPVVVMKAKWRCATFWSLNLHKAQQLKDFPFPASDSSDKLQQTTGPSVRVERAVVDGQLRERTVQGPVVLKN